LGLFIATANISRSQSPPDTLHASFPLGIRELGRIAVRTSFWRTALVLPMAFGFGAVGAWLGGVPPEVGLARAALVAALAPGAHLIVLTLGLASNTNDTSNRWLYVAWFFMLIPFIAILFAAIRISDTRWAMIATTVGAISSFAWWAFYSRFLERGNVDLLR
jgi:hypothetical protein